MEEYANKKETEKSRGGFGDVLAGIGKGLVDGLAERVPIAGKMIQYGVNAAGIETPDYVMQETKRAKAKQDLIKATNENKNWKDLSALRDMGRKFAEDNADARRYQEYEMNAEKMAHNELSGIGLTDPEISDYTGTQEYKTLVQAKYGMENLMSFTNNKDMEAYGIMDRFLKRNGMGVVDGIDPNTGEALKYLSFSVDGTGKSIPITKGSIDNLNQIISNRAQDELKTRMQYGVSKTSGDPTATGLSRVIRSGASYTNGSWSKSKEIFEPMVTGANFADRFWFTANNAIKEYRGNAPLESKQGCIQALLSRPKDDAGNEIGQSLLEQAGYTVDARSLQDALNTGNMGNMILKHQDEKGDWETLTFDDFARRAESKDTLGQTMKARLGSMRESAIRTNKKIFMEEVNRIRDSLKDGKGTGKADKKGGLFGEWSGVEGTNTDASVFNSVYGKENYEKLNRKQREGLNKAVKEFDGVLILVAKKYGAKTKRELPDAALKELENFWADKMKDIGLDPEVYYSKANSLVRQRDIEKKQDDTDKKEQAVEDTEQFNADWDNGYHGDEDSGATFRRNYRLWQEKADRDRAKRSNGEKIKEQREVLNQRGR